MKPLARPFLRADAAHLLRRAAFAPAPGEIERVLADGLDATVERLTSEAAPQDDAADRRDAALRGSDDADVLGGAWLARATTTTAPLRERLVLFWADHFVSALSKVRSGRLLLDQSALFRRRGLGPFLDLATDVARDPAMVRYLDLERTAKDLPNENFARELLELFTVGPGPYTETDVREAARAFTGYGLRGDRFHFAAAAHDDGEKTFLGVRGRLDGDDVVRLAATRPETAPFMARKLARAFLSDDPEAADVAALAAAWRAEDGHVGRTVATLLRSEAFFAPRARAAVTRCPAAFVVATLRACGATSAPAPVELARRVRRMGRALFDAPSVKGYAGGATWLGPAARLARLDFLVAVSESGAPLRPPSLGDGDALRARVEDLVGVAPSDAEIGLLAEAVPEDDAARDVRRLALVLSHPRWDRC